jgi:lipopolysaccharide export system protein LptA
VDVELAGDGQTVQGLSAQDDVQLDLPASAAAAPSRRIKSRSLDADGEPGVPGLRNARFTGDVEFRETVPATKTQAAVERVVTAPALVAKLQSGLGTIDRATFTDGVIVKDGTRNAKGATMVYDVAQGTIALGGAADTPGVVQVTDERINLEAKAIEWRLDGTNMVADTGVKSVLKPAPAGTGAQAVKRPSMLTADQPINVTGAKMTYNQATGHAEYTGDAQLWQGATSIRAKTITLDEATGNLTATESVRSVMRIETRHETPPPPSVRPGDPAAAATVGKPANPAGGPVPMTPAGRPAVTVRDGSPMPAAPASAAAAAVAAATAGKPATPAPPAKPNPKIATDSIATANELVYEDAERRAKYTGAVRMVGEQGQLRGERMELFFDESGHGLDRLEAYDAVRFNLKARPGVGPRWGDGARLTYFADDERYVLVGPKATVVEQMAPQQCRETSGRTLTFFSATDSVVVDSDNNSRTLSQTGTTCQEPTP